MAERKKIRTTFTQYRQQVTASELDLLQKKLEQDPENYDLLDWAAFAFYSHDQVDAAAGMYRRLLTRFPENASYHYYLANALYKKGESAVAIDHWKRVLDLDGSGNFAERARRKLQNLPR